MSYTPVQNTSFLTIASVLQKLISSVYFIVIARFIGVANTGEYFTALTSIAIFTVLADFGIGAVLTRESSKYPERAGAFLSTAFIAKLLFAVTAVGLLALSKIVFNYPPQGWLLVGVAAVTLFLDSLQNTWYGVLRSRRNLLYESAGIIGAQAITLAIGIIAIVYRLPLVWLIVAYAIPSLLSNIYGAVVLWRTTGIRPRWQLEHGVAHLFLAHAWPFALAGFLTRLYSYSDSLLMLRYVGLHEVGWWSVGYKLVYAFQFIPLSLTAVMYPTMSALSLTAPQRIGELYEKCSSYLLVVGLGLSGGILALAGPFVSVLYGPDFAPAVPVLHVLAGSVVFGFFALLNGSTLNAFGQQKAQTTLLGLALVSSVVLNLLLIPRYGIVGAAWVALTTNVLLCVMGWFKVGRYITLPLAAIAKQGARILVSAGLLAGASAGVWRVALPVSPVVHFVLAAALGALIYVSALFFTRAVTPALVIDFKNTLLARRAAPAEASIPANTL